MSDAKNESNVEITGSETDAQTRNRADQHVDEHKEIIKETSQPEEPGDTGDEGGPSGELTLEEQLEAANAEILNYKDMALRAEAEMQNVRRRTERDIEHAHKFGQEKFVQNLLPVVDGIEKAIESFEQAGTDPGDPVFEGVRLCHKLLVDLMSRENIVLVDPEGAPFDPNEHEAMSMVENPDMEPNSVFAVVQKGYKLNGRLIRPAMVMVTKAPG